MSTPDATLSLAKKPASTIASRYPPLPPPPQLILFGDSITQCSAKVVHALSDRYLRRLDVLNRGFGGYNTADALAVYSSFFPSDPPSRSTPRVMVMTILFGANDSCAPGQTQHVPIQSYVRNLKEIIEFEGGKKHKTHVVLITPAPVEEYRLLDGDNRAPAVASYAQAVRELGKVMNVPVFDLWSVFMTKAGWDTNKQPCDAMPGCKQMPPSQSLGQLFSDGLHFTDYGYTVFLEGLVDFIERNIPELIADDMKSWYPEWTEFHPSASSTSI